MRIVHVITRLIIGGAQENTLYTVFDLQEHFNDDVWLVTGPPEGPEGNLFDQTEAHGTNVRLMPELIRAVHPTTDFKAYRRLVAVIKELKPDVVHTHSSKAGILGRMAAWACKVPCIVHTIHGLPFHPFESWTKNQLYIHAERYAARRCHKILSVADAMTRQALDKGIGEPDQYQTVYSGMEVEPFLDAQQQRGAVRQEYGFNEDDVVIAKVARLFEFKGHDDVLEAVRPLVAAFPCLRLLFVGGGIWRDRLEQKTRDLGLADHVVFAGLVPPQKIPELLAASDIVVHASYREGLARVLPQALISGKPVVSYCVDGAPEVVLPDETGYLADTGDKNGLANGLRKLLEDPEKRRAFGQKGRSLFTDQFRHETMTQQIRQVYEAILSSSG